MGEWIRVHNKQITWEPRFMQFVCPALPHTCQVGKVQKREISLFASCQRGRFCAKPFRDINFVHQHLNPTWKFENDEIFPPYKGLKLTIWCKTFYYCTLWILSWLGNAFSLQNSIQIQGSKFMLVNSQNASWNSVLRVENIGARKKLRVWYFI